MNSKEPFSQKILNETTITAHLQDAAFAFSDFNFVDNIFRLTVGLVLQYVYLNYLILPHKWDEMLVYSG
jgi:hypothetical protein